MRSALVWVRASRFLLSFHSSFSQSRRSSNLFSFIYIYVEDALRSGPDASPPLNMRRSVIFNAALVVFVAVIIVVGLRGRQTRRQMVRPASVRKSPALINFRTRRQLERLAGLK